MSIAIKNRLKELENLIQEYPINIPIVKLAKFLGMNEEGLKAAAMRGNLPFGFGYQKDDGGYRVFVIPSVTFYCWFTNTSGRMILSEEL